MTTAFIYAAGRALRLGAAYAAQPKVLLEVGGCSLLEWHLRRLAEAGCAQVAVITGYSREQVAAALPALAGRYGARIEEIVNPHYTEGSVLSLAASLPRILARSEPVLLMDGDVLYPKAMLERLERSAHPTALLFDRDFATTDSDPVLVPIRGGKPVEFRKEWQGSAEAVGESVGLFRVAPADLRLLAEETRRRADGDGRSESYDEVIRALVLAGRFGGEDVTGLPWIELDFPEDIERARRVILPAILQSGVERPFAAGQ
jgi:choline kinase